MKILVISQYYHPEPGATSNRLKSFVDAMIKRGHEVTVICEFPNYPSGILAPKDRWRLFRVEDYGTHKIIRTFVLAFAKKNNIKRMLFYFSFALSSFFAGLIIKRHDIVLSSSPPPFGVFIALVISKLKKSQFVVDIRDLFTDAVQEMGVISNKMLLKMGYNLERSLFKGADVVFTVSKGFKDRIEQRGGAGKTTLIYNGSSEDMLYWNGDTEAVRQAMGWGGKFIIGYVGLIGLPQNLGLLLPEISNIDNKDFLFVFIGDGPGKAEMIRRTEEMKIKNIRFYDHMPREGVIPLIYSADLMMIVLDELEAFKCVIPSKLFDYLGAGKPVISNVDGEVREIIEENHTGRYFTLSKKGDFGLAIATLAKNEQMRRTMGQNGRELVINSFVRKRIMEEAIDIIEKLGK